MTATTGPAAEESSIPRWAAFFSAHLTNVPLVVILRTVSPKEAVTAARAAWAAGVDLVEVTVEREAGLAALEAVISVAPQDRPVGAGTLTTPGRLHQANDLGARFGVAPGLDTDTVAAADERKMPFLPGVATPTEAGRALRLGISVVKAFPASSLGPDWIRALAGPYPGLRVVATGGITAHSAAEFLRAGVIGVGIGRSITEGGGLETLLRELAPDGTERAE